MDTNTDYSDEWISSTKALQLVKPYMSIEWLHTSIKEVQLRRITGGFTNRLYLLTRTTPSIKEPACILIRFFGIQGPLQDPPESNTTLSSTEQALVYYEMGRRGWGPKLYGTFRGGRLEEWIDAHPLTPEESKDPVIRRDIARSYARLHMLLLPIACSFSQPLLHELKSLGQRAEEFAQCLLVNSEERVREFANVLKSTDWTSELGWVFALFVKHSCQFAFVIGDANYLNVLVKNHKSECQVMLIDYETLIHGPRGFDIGGHFNERMYCYDGQDNVLSGHPAPDLQEQLLFCKEYLREEHSLSRELADRDTVAHLLIESKIGRLFHILYSVLMCFSGGLTEKPALLAGLTHMMTMYHHLKADFN
ncbi:MAG: hypothetical protein GOMPHAMPRED_007279 [Gomphillus americanus]|uniref:Uncharacterized protein n=1 Tax=Gomphillus americanus TaxID=1940652 RepID=A0A8H3I875_9LECA|nr:MAG: hypothetical protein GOMPHAMPRED_007279 [Gomphillus americanus]